MAALDILDLVLRGAIPAFVVTTGRSLNLSPVRLKHRLGKSAGCGAAGVHPLGMRGHLPHPTSFERINPSGFRHDSAHGWTMRVVKSNRLMTMDRGIVCLKRTISVHPLSSGGTSRLSGPRILPPFKVSLFSLDYSLYYSVEVFFRGGRKCISYPRGSFLPTPRAVASVILWIRFE